MKFLLGFFAALLVFATGCAGSKLQMNSGVPAAQGLVKTSEEANGNTQIKLSVKHMAQPQAVSPQAGSYVVWAQDNSVTGAVHNIGALKVNSDLEGELSTITPLKKFDLFITTEPAATALYPTGTKTLWTTVEAN